MFSRVSEKIMQKNTNMDSEKSMPRDKYQLRRYLESLNLRDAGSLEERAKEISDNIKRVMTPYYTGERGEPLQYYYVPCQTLLEKALEKRDFKDDFPQALDFLISSLEWE